MSMSEEPDRCDRCNVVIDIDETAYFWKEEVWCLRCMARACDVNTNITEVEHVLNRIANFHDIDRTQSDTFHSTDFPKAYLR